MAMSEVRKLTLAFIRGDVGVTAKDVVAKVRPKPQPAPKSAEQVTLETSEDFTEETDTTDTWADVGRYWDMMTPEQQAELEKERMRKFGE